jgi:hypothetical protein
VAQHANITTYIQRCMNSGSGNFQGDRNSWKFLYLVQYFHSPRPKCSLKVIFKSSFSNIVRRTRACQPYRQRCMRWDETSPHCQQCIPAGRQCPASSEGAVVIDLTAQTAQRSQNPRPNNNARLVVSNASNQSMESSAVAQTC